LLFVSKKLFSLYLRESNYLKVAKYSVQYGINVWNEYRFIRQYLEPLVNSHCSKLSYALTKQERKKVFRYYPILTVCANGENYLYLAGRKLNIEERKRLTLMSAMATLCDDLLDEDGWTEQQLLDLLDDKLVYQSLSAKTKLILCMNEEFKQLHVNDSYWPQLRKAFHAQAESIKQHRTDISLDETLQISKEKNGHTSLMVATLLDENWSEQELAFIYQTGVMGQLANDIFDAWKDVQQGIYTIVRKVDSVSQLREIFMQEYTKLLNLVQQTRATGAQRRRTINRLSVINAFGIVGLEQLEKVEKKYGQPVDWPSIPRQELVVDMEIQSHRWNYLQKIVWLSNHSQQLLK